MVAITLDGELAATELKENLQATHFRIVKGIRHTRIGDHPGR